MTRQSKPRILIVEDNAADIQLFSFALQEVSLDCDLTVIDDGGEALAFARRQDLGVGAAVPDLAVVDLNLPKNDGIEILEAMRANPLFARVPVLLLSSSSSPRDMARIRSFANAQYATKPSFLEQYSDLGRIVRSILDQERSDSMPAG
jgi:CheY-like chemotaxis protein